MVQQFIPAQFVAKWSRTKLPERAASQEHFIDLCRLLGQPTPAEHDATGAEYTFEKGVLTTGAASKGAKGERGFADVWWRGKFGWEYKRKGKYRDLNEAYRQLCQYREALENPPLLIVSDIAHTEIHTNFTGTAKQVHIVELETLAEPSSLDLLRRIFTDPTSFKPTVTPERITEDIAQRFGRLAKSLRDREHDPQTAAHFLMKCMFCLFAEDVGLLAPDLFKTTLMNWQNNPPQLTGVFNSLFDAMRTGGAFGPKRIDWFNGGLFDESPALELNSDEIGTLILAAKQDWSSVEPAVFGTLFERSLDPNTRAQIGAHYTSREDILLVVEPVIMAPLRQEWEQVKTKVGTRLERRSASVKKAKTKAAKNRAASTANKAIANLLQEFVHRLASLRILDPACGSGNFLYVAIQKLLDLEKEVITYAAAPEIALGLIPQVRPTQLHGIEINPYAAELAQVVIWIGYLQWMRDNGFIAPRDPILEPIQTIECRDALIDLSNPDLPVPAQWPDADFIIGNPPFLGSRFFRIQGLEDAYITILHATYEIPNGSDLCCYWFEQARSVIPRQQSVRVGLLATQGIRGGSNRTVLERIKTTGDIFMAWSDREWILDGAAVHVSIIGFDNGIETLRALDGKLVPTINVNLTGAIDLTSAGALKENHDMCSRGSQKRGPFDLDYQKARELLCAPNPNARSNVEVIVPYLNGSDVAGRSRAKWIIDFGAETPQADAATYEAPFEYVRLHVLPKRKQNNDKRLRERWWLHGIAQPEMRARLLGLRRVCVSPRVAKHRLFRWVASPIQPDDQLIVFGRSDDYFFGLLHSSLHELWARGTGSQLREAESGFRYTPRTCFETFPLPWSPGQESTDHDAYRRISDAAKQLNEQRERWLNPPEWIEPIAAAVDAEDDFADVPAEARSLIRQSAIMARAAKDARLKNRTLTNLYNERPTWLRLAHEQLDRAVLAAYVATDTDGDWSEDWAAVWTETGAGRPLPDRHSHTEKRAEVDQRVLANLLRLNLVRAQE